MAWSAQRLSDAPSTAENLSTGMGGLIVFFFLGCAIASAFSSWGVAMVILSVVAAAAFLWMSLSGTMQFRHRTRLRKRLRENGLRTTGVITDRWIIEGSYGAFSVLRYSIRTQDGETHTYAAYDQTPIVWKWADRDTINVLYDPDHPQLAVVDDN
jgi:hypothetical protein